jgi:hypothetical protein
MDSNEQWEKAHAWEPVNKVPYWIRQKYPSMDFKKADHYIITGKTFHYRVFDGLRVERSYKGSKGLVGRAVPKKTRKFGVF